jgi:hypothetical protein
MSRSESFRLTAKGRACVDMVDNGGPAVTWLSRHGHDVLVMCERVASLQQLRQCVPPRSLDESLQSLLALGLIEQHDVQPQGAQEH